MLITEKSSENKKYLIFLGLSALLISMGFVMSPSIYEMFDGLGILITHPSTIDFDSLQHAGHFGSAFFNSGLLLLCALLLYRLTKTDIQGKQIAAAMMVTGYAFYGKNPLNIWFPVFGVLLHARMTRKPLKSVTSTAWFATALSPVFSVLVFGAHVFSTVTPLALFSGAVFGIFSGVLVGALSDYLPALHKGYVLYNAGFAAGLAGTLINSLQRAIGIGFDKYPYVEIADASVRADYVSGSNGTLSIALLVIFAYFVAAGIILGGLKNIGQMLKHKAKGGDYMQEFGLGGTLMNMGVMGMASMLYVFATIEGQLSGPVFGSIFTVMGFAAAGTSLRMHFPLMAGIYATSFLTGGIAGLVAGNEFLTAAILKVASRGMLLAAMFSAGLTPIVGDFGMLSGIFVAFVHTILVPNLGALHGWMSLYNNGFSLGLIATFLYPLYSKCGRRKAAQQEQAVTAALHNPLAYLGIEPVEKSPPEEPDAEAAEIPGETEAAESSEETEA